MRSHREAVLKKVDADAFKVLGLDGEPNSYTVQDVDSAWRTLRSELHPDRPGGDAAKFDAARKAYDAARFYALEPKPCPECEGKGKVPHPSARNKTSFGSEGVLFMTCSACKGKGET